MRILFTFVGGSGHFDPLAPIARAAQEAAHTVAFNCPPAMAAVVQRMGFSALPTGPERDAPTAMLPLLEPDAEREDRQLRDAFADRGARRRSVEVFDLGTEWRADVIVIDETDFGSFIAAERLGLPYASVLVIAAGSFVRHHVVAEPLNAVRAAHGLAPDPDLTMLSRHLVLAPVPPSFRDPAFPLPPTGCALRPTTLFNGSSAATFERAVAGARSPIVYFTLGTVFNMESGDLFERVLAGLRRLPIDVVATVGPQIDPDAFGPQPANVHVVRYLPQARVLPRCDLVVSHGGSGSVIGALAHGLPSVLLPMGADQPLNAARCEQLGVGVTLDAVRVTPDEVRDTVATVLADNAYRRRAEQMRDEIATMPEPATAVDLLERLVAQESPGDR